MKIEKSDNIKVNKDCRFFNGYKPCTPHKKEGVHCDDCRYYKKTDKNILIIKLQAAGEVIRNTVILHKLNKEYQNARIFWITKYPELIPKNHVFKILDWNYENILFLLNQKFDVLYSLDKDIETCSLANIISAEIKKGFSQENGTIIPFDKDAENKWITGIFDDIMKNNRKNYLEETYEICGFKYDSEEYILPEYSIPGVDIKKDKRVIGINTGSGDAWITRRFSEQKWITLIDKLKEKYEIILLGGPKEDELNKRISKITNARYFGTFPIQTFIGLMSLCDLIITSPTMALHISLGLKKKTILVNNIFPTNEYYMFNRGEIIEPKIPCKYCYKARFDSECYSNNCLDLIEDKVVITAIERLIN